MAETEPFAISQDAKAGDKAGRGAYLLESIAIVLLACLAALAAAT